MNQPTSPLRQLETITAHTRPVEALAWDATSSHLHTGDSMGIIKVWELDPNLMGGRRRAKLVGELKGHRTGVNEIWVSSSQVWSGRYTVNHVDFVC